ncbi:MAG TPA: type III polyketide synthase, partial [Myxococcaceae bacterium]|nr:type III polyketide synthase [Myxococcaceae bacterium]
MNSAPAQDSSPVIRAVERLLPTHYARQDQIIGALRALWATRHYNIERLEELHRSVQVDGRFLALP